MSLSQTENSIIYAVALLLGASKDKVTLAPEQYDALKKIDDANRVRVQNQEMPLLPSLNTRGAKELLDAVETISDKTN